MDIVQSKIIDIQDSSDMQWNDWCDFVKKNTSDSPHPQKEVILQYLQKTDGREVWCSPAIIKDVFTGELNGDEYLLVSDGKYRWSSQIVYYLRHYNLRLPEDFVQHILSKS